MFGLQWNQVKLIAHIDENRIVKLNKNSNKSCQKNGNGRLLVW